jgi:urease accessory protein
MGEFRMRGKIVFLLSVIMAFAAGQPAAAHHAMGGQTPTTFIEGLLSGLGHPIIGIDHLAFLAAVGIAVGVAQLSFAMPLAFVGASALGVMLHIQGFTIPAAEAIVGASVLLAGALVARGRIVPSSVWLALFTLAGLIHGYAYGEAVAGAEATPIWAYLVGLFVIQAALTIGIAFITQQVTNPVTPRLAGAVVAGVGLAVLASRVLPA